MSKKDKPVDNALSWAASRVQAGIDAASPAVQDAARRAGREIADGVATLTPKLQRGLDAAGPRISDAVDNAGPRLQKQLDKATPALNSARDKVVDGYIPAAQVKLGDLAALVARKLQGVNTPEQLDVIVARLTGDKKALKKAQKAMIKAAKSASKDLKKSGRRSGKGWLVVGALTTAGVAGVAAWRASQPVEDPWKTPQPTAPRVTTTVSGETATAGGDGKHVAGAGAGPVNSVNGVPTTPTTPAPEAGTTQS